MDSSRRGSIAVVFVACIALLALVAVLPAASIGWRDRGYTGMQLVPGSALVRSVDVDSPAARAGVRAGDRIVPASFSPRQHVALSAARPGLAFDFAIDRASRVYPVAFRAVRKAPNYSLDGAILIVTETASFAIFVVLGALLAALRPGPMTFWLFAFGICTAPLDAVGPYYASVAPEALAVPVYVLTHVIFGGWSVLTLLPFVLRFPSGELARGWRRTANAFALGYVALGLAYYVALALRDVRTFDRAAQIADDIPALVAFAAAFAIVIAGVATSDGPTRQRMRWAVVGMTFGFLAFVTDYVPNKSLQLDPIANTLAVVMPLALAYAVFKQRVIDVRVFVSRAAVYAASTALLVVAIGLLEWGIGEVVGETHVATYLTAAASVVIGLLFDRVHARTQAIIEALVFRERSEAEAYLRLVTRGLRFAETVPSVDAALAQEPCRALELASVVLYRLADENRTYAPVAVAGEAATPSILAHDAEWVRQLRSEAGPIRIDGDRLAIPLLLGTELLGFGLFAPHRDGSEIDPVETRSLEALVRAGAIALGRIETAASRERVTELETRLRTLEAELARRPANG